MSSQSELPAEAAGPPVLPVLLECSVQGSYVQAGVLLLTSEPNTRIEKSSSLLDALAAYLIDAGDVCPQIPETQALG